MLARIARSTPAARLGAAGCLMGLSFAGGFASSRYGIDRHLADSVAVLDRSAHAFEAEQMLLFDRWADSRAQLNRRLAALSQGKEALPRGRR